MDEFLSFLSGLPWGVPLGVGLFYLSRRCPLRRR